MRIVTLILVLIFSTACLVDEKIEPSFQEKKLETHFDNEPFFFHIPVIPRGSGDGDVVLSNNGRIVVDDMFGSIGDVSNVGNFFRLVAERMADFEIQTGTTGNLHLDEIEFEFTELNELNFDVIKEVALENVHFIMDEPEVKEEDETDFRFIKTIQVYIKFDENQPISGGGNVGTNNIVDENLNLDDKDDDSNGDDSIVTDDGSIFVTGPEVESRYEGAHLVLSYDKSEAIGYLGCGGYCMDMQVEEFDWRSKLEKQRNFKIYIKVQLDHAPKRAFSFQGYIDVKVLLNLNGI